MLSIKILIPTLLHTLHISERSLNLNLVTSVTEKSFGGATSCAQAEGIPFDEVADGA